MDFAQTARFFAANNLNPGGDQLFEMGWFYSIDGDPDPSSLANPDVQNYSGNVGTFTWNDVDSRGLFSAVWTVTLTDLNPLSGTGGGGPGGLASVVHNLTLTPLNGRSSNITQWLYADWDAGTSAGGDSAVLLTPDNEMLITDGGNGDFVFFSMISASPITHAVAPFAGLRTGIDDGTAVPLANTGLPFGPADFTGAFETSGTASLSLAPIAINGQIGVNNIPQRLPVELTAFNVSMDDDTALISWATASETDNAGFEVQQAVGEGDFQSLSFIEGAGTTSDAQSYSFRVDGLDYGHHKFRLKQFDFDGAFEYSRVIETDRILPDGYVLGAFYPNPFNPQGRFTLLIASDQNVEVGVYNLMGQFVDVLHRGQLTGQDRHTFTFTANGLPGGPYFIRIVGENFVGQQQVTLVK